MKLKTLFFKAALLFFALVVTFFIFLMGIQVSTSTSAIKPTFGLFLVAVGLASLCVYRGLFFLNKAVDLIGADQPFSTAILPLVKKIRRSLLWLGCSLCGILPFFYEGVQLEDAPGLMLIGLAIVLTPFAVFVFSQIVEELFKKAIELKQEQDLTI